MYFLIPQGILHKYLSPSSSLDVKALLWPGVGPEQQLEGAKSSGRTLVSGLIWGSELNFQE